jgi:iron complex transport system substrate-binding protein
MNRLILLFSACFFVGGFAPALSAEEALRVVSAGGAITETVYALGAEKCLVGADTSSVYPEAAAKLPQVGYMRMLSAEGVLSLKPGVLLTTVEGGPPNVLEQIRGAGVEVLQLSNEHTVAAVEERIRKVAAALKVETKADAVIESMRKDLKAAEEKVKTFSGKPRVLFIYARGGGTVNVSGTKTAADAIIALAGGVNAVTGYEGYKPLTAEAAVAAAPDFILVTSRGLEGAGGIDNFLKQPGLELTPAGKNRRVIAMDDLYLLGFGPRLGQAALELCRLLHPDKAVAQSASAP